MKSVTFDHGGDELTVQVTGNHPKLREALVTANLPTSGYNYSVEGVVIDLDSEVREGDTITTNPVDKKVG